MKTWVFVTLLLLLMLPICALPLLCPADCDLSGFLSTGEIQEELSPSQSAGF